MLKIHLNNINCTFNFMFLFGITYFKIINFLNIFYYLLIKIKYKDSVLLILKVNFIKNYKLFSFIILYINI